MHLNSCHTRPQTCTDHCYEQLTAILCRSKQSPEQQAKATAMEAEARAQADAAAAKKNAENDVRSHAKLLPIHTDD